MPLYCSAVLLSAYSNFQHRAVQYSAIQYSSVVQCSAVQYSAMQFSPAQCRAEQNSTIVQGHGREGTALRIMRSFLSGSHGMTGRAERNPDVPAGRPRNGEVPKRRRGGFPLPAPR